MLIVAGQQPRAETVPGLHMCEGRMNSQLRSQKRTEHVGIFGGWHCVHVRVCMQWVCVCALACVCVSVSSTPITVKKDSHYSKDYRVSSSSTGCEHCLLSTRVTQSE